MLGLVYVWSALVHTVEPSSAWTRRPSSPRCWTWRWAGRTCTRSRAPRPRAPRRASSLSRRLPTGREPPLPASMPSVRLQALSRSLGGSLFQVVLALWALLLCRHAGQEEVVVGSPYHGRDAAGTEGLIGYFVNMLALRVEVGRGCGVGSVVRGARDAASGGLRHGALPFQQLVHEELPRRLHDASRNAVFQAMLAWGAAADDESEASARFGGALGAKSGTWWSARRLLGWKINNKIKRKLSDINDIVPRFI